MIIMYKTLNSDALIKKISLPTLADLRTFFRSHDWSADSLSSPSDRSPDKQSDMEYVKKILDSQFEKSAREKGLKAPSKYYAKDNSLIVLRDNVEDLISDAVTDLVDDTVRAFCKGYGTIFLVGKWNRGFSKQLFCQTSFRCPCSWIFGSRLR